MADFGFAGAARDTGRCVCRARRGNPLGGLVLPFFVCAKKTVQGGLVVSTGEMFF